LTNITKNRIRFSFDGRLYVKLLICPVIATKILLTYEISISQMPMDIFRFLYIISFICQRQDCNRTWLYDQHGRFRIRNKNCLPSASPWVHPRFLVRLVLLIFQFSVLCYVIFVYLYSVLHSQCYPCLWIVHSWLPLRFYLTFIYVATFQQLLHVIHLSGLVILLMISW